MEQAASTPDENKARQRRFVEEVQGKGNLEAIDDFIAPDVIDHTPPPGMAGDRDSAKQVIGGIRAAFPDHDATVVHMLAEGDLVATYKTFTGTHRGDFMGIPATGKRATIRVMDIVRYRNGQVAEHWNVVDVAGLMQQLGVMP